MRFKIVTLIICCCCTFTALAQTNYAVKGIVSDTTTNVKMDQATISVLDARDSILQKFTYADKGAFNISNLKPGKFLIMVNYPDYADFVESFTLDASKPVYNFGNIKMILQSKLLNEVIIKAKVVAIKIKGDTTEFNAAAYATQKNAKVEDLLKQLQGMKINQSGVIIFQGEPVTKILVDGEEFFSDDPGLVSKTVRADMVSKVQVYDQKSDQAKLTGIEDGVKVKTINIVLREDKRKGVFGKVDGGYGTDDYYTGQMMFNKFDPKKKIAAYGNIGNTGNVGLSGDNNSKYGAGYSRGNYGGNGLPFARDGGAHYDNKWNNDKQSINANYKIGALTTEGSSNTMTQNNLPDNFNKTTSNKSFRRYSFNQNLDADFTSKLDSTSDLSASVYGSIDPGTSDNKTQSFTLRGNGVLLNDNDVSSIGSNNYKYMIASANYTKRFKKKGRSISLNTRGSSSQFRSDNYMKSDLKYYNGMGELDSVNSIDQYKPTASNSNSVSAGFSYNETLFKSISLSASYNFSQSIGTNSQLSFDKSTDRYDKLDSVFSNNFKVKTITNFYNLRIGYTTTKVNLNIGTGISDADSEQKDQLASADLNRRFTNWRPNARFTYQLSKAAAITLNYNGNTTQPNDYQLQPLRQNTDPLNITLGNPMLKPSFNNSFSFNYRLYQPTLDRGINFNANYGRNINTIVYNRVTDSSGVSTSQWSNLTSKQPTDWKVNTEFYGHATKLNFILSLNFEVDGRNSFNYVNGQLNESKSIDYSPYVSIWANTATYSYNFNIGPKYYLNSSSLQQINNNRHGFFTDLGFSTKLPYNFFISAEMNYQYTAKNKVFNQDFSRVLLKSSIGKTFLKEENLKITISGNDLLNQNTGFSRYGSIDSFTETRNTTIRRYFMFSVTWDFAKFGKSLQPQQ
ncbi:TonB-dependent receptor [Pedobacter foliorum]|uniref:TonB-dependent receptor n=1 Tax=Pedobacter foliorum TaxID=2739058 RepID=UPI001565481B|nr:TonB-dependent receptor [Pedobacter foliorum]NRF40638.1 TonB-dependent receptor [Pedobacter foliorum]